ncbi:MAG: hypothetical protein HRF49_12430 [bacterium]
MPIPKDAKFGKQLVIKNKLVDFSFWPTRRGIRRAGLGWKVHTRNPWPIIESHINKKCPAGSRESAIFFLNQASDYFQAATSSGVSAARPVLIYYCMLNLACTTSLHV